MQSSATIVDIAEELNISPSTVSRALKDHPRISETTKKKVRSVAERLGYRPNTLAAGLRSKHSNTIGLIVPRVSMYFHSVAITVIQNVIHEAGYNIIICQSNDLIELEKELVKTLFDARVDGLIVSATMFTTDFSHFSLFTNHGIPIVFYDRVPREFPATIFRGDDYHGGFQAGDYLLDKGCVDIGFINGLLSSNLYQDRQAGFLDALEKRKITLKKDRIFNQLLTKENAIDTCKKLFYNKPYPDAVFCANDTTAIEVHRFVRKLGLEIPKDIKIVGYSNDPGSDIISPSITTVEQHPKEMGTLAAKTILSMIKKKEGSKQEQKETIIPTNLIIREST